MLSKTVIGLVVLGLAIGVAHKIRSSEGGSETTQAGALSKEALYLERMRKKLFSDHPLSPVPKQLKYLPNAMNTTAVILEAVRKFNGTLVHTDPPVAVIDNFLSPAECDVLIGWAHKEGLQRSVLAGDKGAEGKFERPVSDIRTSANAWCYPACFNDPPVRAISDSLARLTQVRVLHGAHGCALAAD